MTSPPRITVAASDAKAGAHLGVALWLFRRHQRSVGHPVPAWVTDPRLEVHVAETDQARPGPTPLDEQSAGPEGARVPLPLMNLDEVADRLGVTRRTVERVVAAGALATVRVRSRRLVRSEDVEAFVSDARSTA